MSKDKKSSQNKGKGNRDVRSSGTAGLYPSERELIIVAKSEHELRVTRKGITSAIGSDVSQLADLLSTEGVTMHPLFGISEERIKLEVSALEGITNTKMPDMSVYYRVDAPDERLDELAEKIQHIDTIESVYIKPPTEPAEIFLMYLVPRD
jgi:hypothetical protein